MTYLSMQENREMFLYTPLLEFLDTIMKVNAYLQVSLQDDMAQLEQFFLQKMIFDL